MKMEKVEVAFDPDTLSLSIYPIVMVKVLENDYLLQSGRDIKGETHFNPINSSSSSKVIRECGPFSICLSFLTYSSLKGSSSTGYQSILSQNSWSSADSSPVLMNSSNMSRFINLTTALANNSESNLGSFFVTTSPPISITNNNIDSEYINTNTFSVSKINGTTRLHEINTEEENDDHVMVLENYGLKEKIERR